MDWIETKTASLLTAAKRSRWFRDIIDDAERFHAEGYAWDVALAISCGYWLS